MDANEALQVLQSFISTTLYNNHYSISFLFLSLLLLLLFTQYFLRHKHGVINLPPTPGFPIPLIGHLHLLRSAIHISLRHLSQKHGPLISLNLGQFPTIVASSPEIAEKILKTHDTHFCTRTSLTATSRYSYGGLDIGFSPYNHHWMQLRRFANAHLFNPSNVQRLRVIREQEVEATMNAISANSTSPVNMNDITISLYNNIMFREVFGKRPMMINGDDGECGLRSPYHELIAEVIYFMGDFSLGDLFPSLAWMDVVRGWKRKLERSFRALDAVFEKEIVEGMKRRDRHHEAAGSANAKEEDSCFLDVILRHLIGDDHIGKNDSLGLQLNRLEAKALLMNVFIGGTDDPASVTEWAMTNLMRNPEIMRKVQEEIRQLVGNKKHVEESDLHELCYLKMVIKETLRLHPPSPLLIHRECLKDTIIEGYNIPARTRVLVNAWAIGRDSKYWDDPEAFRPERFESSPITYMGNHFQLIPFGAGRRICPGMALGIIGIELVMANLLFSFNWDFPAGMSQNDVNMTEAFGIVSHKKNPLLLVPSVA